MKQVFLFQLILFFICISRVVGQQVSGIQHEQSGQNIKVSYTLSSSFPVEIRLEVSTDNGKTFSAPLNKVSGDVGKSITAGQKQIVWRVLEEVPQLVGDGVVFRVSVLDEKRPNTGFTEVNRVGNKSNLLLRNNVISFSIGVQPIEEYLFLGFNYERFFSKKRFSSNINTNYWGENLIIHYDVKLNFFLSPQQKFRIFTGPFLNSKYDRLFKMGYKKVMLEGFWGLTLGLDFALVKRLRGLLGFELFKYYGGNRAFIYTAWGFNF
ncbi:MAG: hypothetical protein EBS07_06845 [Sphingobacteriia bacterium]|nr:hypothetical protein [Sphingobacteriia bacterium]